MGKLRHGDGKWPAQERTWIPRTSQPANSKTWGGKGHNGKASDLSRPGGTEKGRPSCPDTLARRMEQRAAAAASLLQERPLVVPGVPAHGGGRSALEGLFSRGPRPPPSPRARAGTAGRRGRPNLFALLMANAKLRGGSDLFKAAGCGSPSRPASQGRVRHLPSPPTPHS